MPRCKVCFFSFVIRKACDLARQKGAPRGALAAFLAYSLISSEAMMTPPPVFLCALGYNQSREQCFGERIEYYDKSGLYDQGSPDL